MVFFVCEGCGSSVKKPQMEKHQMQCRNSYAVSCMDCNKHFNGSEYKSHTKCITENEKYSAKGTVFADAKGERKQQSWFEQVQKAIESVGIEQTNRQVRDLLNKLMDYPNIPRKEAKFKNFLSNSLRIHNPAIVSDVWKAISAAAIAPSTTPNGNNSGSPGQKPPQSGAVSNGMKGAVSDSGTNATEEPSKKRPIENGEQQGDVKQVEESSNPKKRLKQQSSNGDYTSMNFDYSSAEKEVSTANQKGESETDKNSKFNWKKTIKSTLKSQSNAEMKLSSLRKKVIASYNARYGGEPVLSQDDLLKKFEERLSKCSNVSVDGNRVRCVKQADES